MFPFPRRLGGNPEPAEASENGCWSFQLAQILDGMLNVESLPDINNRLYPTRHEIDGAKSTE